MDAGWRGNSVPRTRAVQASAVIWVHDAWRVATAPKAVSECNSFINVRSGTESLTEVSSPE
jgi:hypothetical protein